MGEERAFSKRSSDSARTTRREAVGFLNAMALKDLSDHVGHAVQRAVERDLRVAVTARTCCRKCAAEHVAPRAGGAVVSTARSAGERVEAPGVRRREVSRPTEDASSRRAGARG
jgi:hypothetical protein